MNSKPTKTTVPQTGISLSTVNHGALEELFQRAWVQLQENVLDPNIPAEKNRSVVCTLTFIPVKDGMRGQGVLHVEAVPKLAKRRGDMKPAWLDRKDGVIGTIQRDDPRQIDLDDELEEQENVARLADRKAGADGS